jgi:hypothetical protein
MTNRMIRFLAYCVLACVVLGNTGCIVPVPVSVRPVDLPGWGEPFAIRNPDGTPHDGGYLVVEYSEKPGLGAKEWGIDGEKHELHVIPIADGRATLPPKRVWKSIWAWGMDGGWHPDSLTRSYVLERGMHPYASGPGHWLHGFVVGAKWSPESRYAGFRTLPPRERLECTLRTVNELDEAHAALLERLSKATETFHTYQKYGLKGEELSVISKFAQEEFAAFKVGNGIGH